MTKQRMTKFEFEIQVEMKVSAEEYNIIEMAYQKSRLDLEAFCERWAKVNLSRILAYKRTKRLNLIANSFAKECRSICKIMSRYHDCPGACASEVMDDEEQDKLESVGLSFTYRYDDGFLYDKTIKDLEDDILELQSIILARKAVKKAAQKTA